MLKWARELQPGDLLYLEYYCSYGVVLRVVIKNDYTNLWFLTYDKSENRPYIRRWTPNIDYVVEVGNNDKKDLKT